MVGETGICQRSIWIILRFQTVTRQQKREHLVRFATHERLRATATELALNEVKLHTQTDKYTDTKYTSQMMDFNCKVYVDLYSA